jgi:beta-mannosidase
LKLHDDDATRKALSLVQAAGMNMLRVGGTMAYESDAFYDECDRLGILVWQDFMFANCDYPADDAEFMRSVQREVQQLLSRLEPRACVAVLCGSSEVEQQIAMLGLPRAQWKPPLFETTLRELAKQGRPEAPYLPSTPTGGALPFQPNSGVTHYYGVGAYLRPLEDARRADVKFAAECLAFSNVPEPVLVEQLLDGKSPFHHPRWKERVPRDNGSGWDFEDVRDHYVKLLFGVEPLQLRYEDPERALEIGRIATGEVMARTLSEWRRRDSACRGALIWLLRDLWPGAGWGLLDSAGNPKAAYYFVKRAMQPRALFVSDEGNNGLSIHAFNDTPQDWQGELELGLWRAGSVLVELVKTRISVPPHAAIEVAGAGLFDHFVDLSHAFRFGPASYDVAVARVVSASGELVSQASHYLCPFDTDRDVGLKGRIEQTPDGPRAVLTATRFARAVALDLPGFLPSDSYFDLLAGETRTVGILAQNPASAVAAEVPKGTVRSLAQRSPIRLQ